MNLILDNFHLSENNRNIINEWKQSSKEFPLIIYGEYGVGKSSLAKVLLFEYNIIEYSNGLDLDDCLIATDISMMFSNKNKKALLFYGYHKIIEYIIKNDKYRNKAIIITMNINDYSNIIKNLYRRCFKINLKYSNNEWIQILKTLNSNNINNINYTELLKKSNYNINNIIINLKYYGNNTEDINYYDINKKNICKETEKILYNEFTVSELDILFTNNIISLNLIDQLHLIIKPKLEYLNKEYIKTIIKIYNNVIYGDINMKINSNYDIKQIYFIFLPYYLLKKSTVNKINLNYNKYISKSIINTNIHNIKRQQNINNEIYYKLIYDIINNSYNKDNNLIINLKVLKYFYKLYILINNKKYPFKLIRGKLL